jgi:hypothetical protein
MFIFWLVECICNGGLGTVTLCASSSPLLWLQVMLVGGPLQQALLLAATLEKNTLACR